MTPLDRLLALDDIRRLVLRYSVAIADRDVDLMVSLYDDEASFGLYGTGEDALRRLMEATAGDLVFGVILVANHLVDIVDDRQATGEVWARCYAQNADGYYEQLIRYVDRYVDRGAAGAPDWRFANRKHLLWFGEPQPSPLAQAPANWPDSQVGIGNIPLADPAVVAWRESRGV